jgi:hypothetical protein
MHPEIARAIELVKENKWSIEQLYTFWWSGSSSDGKRTAIPQTLHDPITSKRIFTEGSSMIFSIATRAVLVGSGEFVDLDEEKSLIIRKATWSSEWWNWMQTSHLRTYPSQRLLRIYIPASLADLSSQAEQINIAFESARLPAVLKFRRQLGIFADAMVVWVDEDVLHESLNLISKSLPLSGMRSAPPPLTKVFSGVGISDHPQSGESLGWLFCKLIWTASKANSHFDLETRFKYLGLNIESPWLVARKESDKDWGSLL